MSNEQKLQPTMNVLLDIHSGTVRISASSYPVEYRRYASLRITTDSSYEAEGSGYCPAESVQVGLSPEGRDQLIRALQQIDKDCDLKRSEDQGLAARIVTKLLEDLRGSSVNDSYPEAYKLLVEFRADMLDSISEVLQSSRKEG